MKPYDHLTREGQIRRVRRLAEQALSHYDLDVISISPIQHFLNTVFRVDARPIGNGARDVERYALRVHKPVGQGTTRIASELAWTAALRRELGVVVPEPVAARDGSLIVEADAVGVPGPRPCVLFRWVHGRFLGRSLSVAAMESVGEFMARLHTHSETFQPTEGFNRPKWDIDGLFGAAVGLDADKAFAVLSAEERGVINRTADVVRRAQEQLGESRQVFGMIHGDFHQGNYLFHRGEVRAIDFDFCGWGHYAYDIGVCFSAGQRHLEYPALREAFLRSYRRLRALSPEEESLLDTFAAAFRMGHAMWLSARLDDPAFSGRAREWVTQRIGQLESFLESSP